MKKAFPLFLAFACCAIASGASGPGGPNRPASWDAQNQAMGYLVMHLSSINAINGLNLTRAQAEELRSLARRIESAGARAPDLGLPCRPDLSEVRDTYVEVRRTLLAGREADESLRQKAAGARQTQALAARLSLVRKPQETGGCGRCHVEPQATDVRQAAGAKSAEAANVAVPWSKKEIFLEHQVGLFGKEAAKELALLAPRVDRILTDGQQEALRDFSCCLLPPKNLADPVRIGQADGGEKPEEILRQVRSVPDAQWSFVKNRLLDRVANVLILFEPAAGEDRMAEARRLVSEIYDRARSLSAVDFEIEKQELAQRLTRVAKTAQEMNDRQQAYLRATFLLLPGAADAYTALIQRLNASAPTGAE